LHSFAQTSTADQSLLDSRDRIAHRWYALRNLFDPQAVPEQSPVQAPARVPALAVFSLAGGVGKTSLVAALGRSLASRGETVLLVDTAIYGLMPFYFGARDQRPGQLRTFNPPVVTAESPVQLITLDPEGPGPGGDPTTVPGSVGHLDKGQFSSLDYGQDWLTNEVLRLSRGSSRILIDLPTASGATTRRILKLAPIVIVPVVPDMNSVVSVSAIESFFRNNIGLHPRSSQSSANNATMPYYLLNQFDYSLPLHLDVREVLRDQLGDRLLPFALRRSPAVSEALAEGMTVIDYAPAANIAEDYAALAGWARNLTAPANVAHRGVRWSER
jgi:cellulose synthase operon protein YhjQ